MLSRASPIIFLMNTVKYQPLVFGVMATAVRNYILTPMCVLSGQLHETE